MDPHTTIKLVDNPIYVIDFKQYAKRNSESHLTLRQRINHVVAFPLKATTLFFEALVQSNWMTLTHMRISFFQNVLGYYGPLSQFKPPSDIYLAAFKIAFWILGTAWYTTKTTCDLFIQKMWGNVQDKSLYYLERFNPEMDMDHIQTKELVLDASKVPAEIQVDSLFTLFDAINFTDPGVPGYMKESSRVESRITYTVDELRTSLSKYIYNIKNRVAFLGTPPAHDTPKLMRFYQHIEDATRLSIYKVTQELDKFKEKHPLGLSQYEEKELNEYKNLLENCARVALDLSIAGNHCGARYMGDVTTLYSDMHGEITLTAETLHDHLIEILAKRRGEIARGQIQKYFGTDTHQFSLYMSELGRILSIPGTQNVVEYLSNRLDRDLFLKRFFEEYTTEDIIATIQTHVKKSIAFLDKIKGWIQDTQVGTWEPLGFEKKSERILSRVDSIVQREDLDNWTALGNLQHLHGLMVHLKDQVPRSSSNSLILENNNIFKYVDSLIQTFKYLETALYPELKKKKFDADKARSALTAHLRNNKADLEKLSEIDLLIEVFTCIDRAVYPLGSEITDSDDQSSESFQLPTIAPLLAYMKFKEKKGVLFSQLPWKSFGEEVFGLDQSKKWLAEQFPNQLERVKIIGELKALCTQETLGNELYEEWNSVILNGNTLVVDHFKTRFIYLEKVKEIQKACQDLGLETDVILRALEAKNITAVIKDRLNKFRGEKLVDAIKLLEMGTSGLSPEIMEWLLVSHRVFLPQNIVEVTS